MSGLPWESLVKAYQSFLDRRQNDQGGGTEYLKGLQEAVKVIANDNSTSTVMMIFMSDGEDGGPDPLPTISNLRQNYLSSAEKLLQSMANIGDGQMYPALTGDQLKQVFQKIAADCTVANSLVADFTKILSEEISWKIMADCL